MIVHIDTMSHVDHIAVILCFDVCKCVIILASTHRYSLVLSSTLKQNTLNMAMYFTSVHITQNCGYRAHVTEGHVSQTLSKIQYH